MGKKDLMTIEHITPQLASRPGNRPRVLLLHATAGGSALSSISWLRKIGLSYHYVIERDGLVYKCVNTSRVAFHAGVSVGPFGKYVNNYSIGVALANRNDGREQPTPQQLDSTRILSDTLAKYIPTIQYVTGHFLVSPGRKTDPKMLDVAAFAASMNQEVMPWRPDSSFSWVSK